MDSNKVLSALSYFSVLFAGIIFPIIVFFVVENIETKRHAKQALISHLCLLVPVPILIFSLFVAFENDGMPLMFITAVVLSIVISLTVLIWNMIKGIKVLSTN
ncbi:hypothetical protein AB1L05_07650 [Cytobacillus horneckiae]|uniref:DUF4870 domain-containing protein n=1 Tax=Cytobacillus horneckiae TaxID=549687 RepID=A0A2N0ZBP1_9BACI|nr:hypothetical protein [Cytobacillus horneckiae]NRG46281.1 hypothetical protein [Bacillus sp. CRN 9]MCM3178937.1 hypothetical protein [Cytobacillus horneckiae]MEC1154153.1 hypothetical protein [Cytobacillus horneckiae]MED2936302.1 hypothetical protein [Cytobacillus horneckiae]PKG26937.1 hypothetical protein CWS20_21770 [Cytobacillus horneckiae]